MTKLEISMKNTVVIVKDINDEKGFPILHFRETSSVEVVESGDERLVVLGFDGGPIPGPVGFSRDITRVVREEQN